MGYLFFIRLEMIKIMSAVETFFRQAGNLYQNPELYDYVMNVPNHEFDFYKSRLDRLGNSALELACGTGRLTLQLLSSNQYLECDGLDLSSDMIAFARKKASRMGLSAKFFEANMADFYLGKKYDMVYVPLSSFLYLHDFSDIQTCLKSVRSHLKEEGQLVISIFNPSMKVLSLLPDERYVIKKFTDPRNGKEVTVEQSSNYDCAKQVNYATHYYSYQDKKDFFSHPVNLRMIFPQELRAIFDTAGYKIDDLYGDYNQTPFMPNSPMQIICAHS